ncbi:MAG: hypothetical protein V1747_07250 [Candidatus Omnitrophota bacterium]
MKNTAVSVVIVFLFFTQNCFAAGVRIPQFELASEISQIAYKEPGVMKQSGSMSGIVGSYTFLDEVMLKLEARLSYGQVDYSSINTGSMDSIDDILCEFRALAGCNISPQPECIILPYFGYGYRYLEDDSQGRVTTTGHLGYKREANYYYSPIGISVIKDIGSGFIMGLSLEYDFFWLGIQKSYLSDAIPARSDLENKQKTGYGYRASLKIEKQQKHLDFVIEPFIRYWKVEQSESADMSDSGIIIGYGYEPKNYSTEYGIKIALHF